MTNSRFHNSQQVVIMSSHNTTSSVINDKKLSSNSNGDDSSNGDGLLCYDPCFYDRCGHGKECPGYGATNPTYQSPIILLTKQQFNDIGKFFPTKSDSNQQQQQQQQ